MKRIKRFLRTTLYWLSDFLEYLGNLCGPIVETPYEKPEEIEIWFETPTNGHAEATLHHWKENDE